MKTTQLIPTNARRDPTKCFVMMPIKKGYDDIYEHVIKPTFAELGIKCDRADEIYSTNPIVNDIWNEIQTSGWIVADLTGRNPNVFYELGLAHAIGANAILLTQEIKDVPFDLQHWRCIVYEQSIAGAKALSDTLAMTVKEDPGYTHVPLALLTEKFKRGFKVCRSHTIVRLLGRDGVRALFKESWQLEAIKRGQFSEFIRKIQTDGQLSDVKCVGCKADVKKFMEGVFVAHMNLESDVPRGGRVDYSLSYTIGNGFSRGAEFWNFNFDSDTDEFVYEFHFLGPTKTDGFMAYRIHDEKKTELTVVKKIEKESVIYIASCKGALAEEAVQFRWKWL
jgi:hypothetical protein